MNKPSLGSSESLSSNKLDKDMKDKNCNTFDTNIEKTHDFVQKLVVIPEICGVCHKKLVWKIFFCLLW